MIWRGYTKIQHTNTIANFLPLMVAARKCFAQGTLDHTDYIELLKALECYAYRVYLFAGRRSNAGQTYLYRWGFEVFTQIKPLSYVIAGIYSLMPWYSDENTFKRELAQIDNWYKDMSCLRYTLFEYELHLLAKEGHNKQPHLRWEQLSNSTIEHILPQNPPVGSHWWQVWNEQQHKQCVHDIGNLVLTHDNSSYSNFEFERKVGKPGVSPSYSDSDIRQERKIASFAAWSPQEFQTRREKLVQWIATRWTPPTQAADVVLDIDAEEETDDVQPVGQGV